ncbi:MAG: tetratricopeptide repeat protein [Thermoplasmatales archaeon]|nr:tetratricopeptide repeat protein [Thermoplasmatales archaeon]
MADMSRKATEKAKRQRSSGNGAGAVATLRERISEEPTDNAARMLLADILFNDMRDEGGGVEQLDAILRNDPGHDDARKALITVLKKKRRHAEEVACHYQILVDRYPDDDALINSYAIFCKYQLTEFDKAAELYERAIDLAPNNPDYRINYSILLVKDLKDYAKGRVQIERAIELDPSNTEARRAHEKLMKRKFRDELPGTGFLGRFRRKPR